MSAAGQDLLSVVRLLVDEPRAVEIREADAETRTELLLGVAERDRGKVIGRRGRTIEALRSLLRIRGEREGCGYDVELLED